MYIFEESVSIYCDIDLGDKDIQAESYLIVDNVVARNINVVKNMTAYGDIEAEIITANSIVAKSIEANRIISHNDVRVKKKIKAENLNAWNVEANRIKVDTITCMNMVAQSIRAKEILYNAYCIAYRVLRCPKIQSNREQHICVCIDKNKFID